MLVNLIDNDESLAKLLPEWRALAGDLPFHEFEWSAAWWRHYQECRAKLFTLVVRDDAGALLAVAPWYLSDLPGQGRVVRFLASGEVCSDYQTIHCRPENRAAAARSLANWLAVEHPHDWDFVELSGVRENDPTIEVFAGQLRDWGHRIHQRPEQACWQTNLPTSWDEFLKSLSKSRRERTRQLLRRNYDCGRAVLHQVKTEAELERGFEVLIDLHQKRRQALGQAGCFASRRFTEFHRDIASRMLALGKLRLLWTELEGRPAAAEYSLIGGNTIYYYQGGFEPKLSDERPGWLNFAASLRLAVNDGFRHFDFLRGDESYKASWAAEARPQVELRIVGRHTGARMRDAAWQTRQTVKRWARQGLALGDTLTSEVCRATGWKCKPQTTSEERA